MCTTLPKAVAESTCQIDRTMDLSERWTRDLTVVWGLSDSDSPAMIMWFRLPKVRCQRTEVEGVAVRRVHGDPNLSCLDTPS